MFGDGGEYLATEEGQLEEEVDDTRVWSLHHRCRLPVTRLTLQVHTHSRDGGSGGYTVVRSELWHSGGCTQPGLRESGGYTVGGFVARWNPTYVWNNYT